MLTTRGAEPRQGTVARLALWPHSMITKDPAPMGTAILRDRDDRAGCRSADGLCATCPVQLEVPPPPSTSAASGLLSCRNCPAPQGFVGLTDDLGCGTERSERPQEPAVRLVLPGHRAMALPAVAAQRVESPVIAGPGIGVGHHGLAVGQGSFRQHRPGQARGRMRRGHRARVGAGSQLVAARLRREPGRLRSHQVLVRAHAPILPPSRNDHGSVIICP